MWGDLNMIHPEAKNDYKTKHRKSVKCFTTTVTVSNQQILNKSVELPTLYTLSETGIVQRCQTGKSQDISIIQEKGKELVMYDFVQV